MPLRSRLLDLQPLGVLALRHKGRAEGGGRAGGRAAYPLVMFLRFCLPVVHYFVTPLVLFFAMFRRNRNRIRNRYKILIPYPYEHPFTKYEAVTVGCETVTVTIRNGIRYKVRSGNRYDTRSRDDRYKTQSKKSPDFFLFFCFFLVIFRAETERRSPSGLSFSVTTAIRCCRGSYKSPRLSQGLAVCRRRSLPPSSARPPRVP